MAGGVGDLVPKVVGVPPLTPPVLKPDLDLKVFQLQLLCQQQPLLLRDVLCLAKGRLKSFTLHFRKYGSIDNALAVISHLSRVVVVRDSPARPSTRSRTRHPLLTHDTFLVPQSQP